jgi:hypothetical protein
MEIAIANVPGNSLKNRHIRKLTIELAAELRGKIYTGIRKIYVSTVRERISIIVNAAAYKILISVRSTIKIRIVERITFATVVNVTYVRKSTSDNNVTHEKILATTTKATNTNITLLKQFNNLLETHIRTYLQK